MWVFPGGRVDPHDQTGDGDEIATARRAAVREAQEEAGLVLDPSSLEYLAHWTPPLGIAQRRYATWFFLAAAPGTEVTIDEGEISAAAWMRPAEALTRRDAGEIELAPPTWMTLHHVGGFDDVGTLLADAVAREPVVYVTRVGTGASGPAALWAGDAGFDTGDTDLPGPRDRLWLGEDQWRLDRTP